MFISLLMVLVIGAIAWVGVGLNLTYLFVVILPYVAAAVFVVGVSWRMIYWSKSPVPFCIPTTGGQQKSLGWIKQATLDNPSTTWEVVKRMFLEVFLFRSLFRNTQADVRVDGPRVIYYSSKWLWCFSLLFHYCFLIIFLHHFRFFTEPVPILFTWLEALDGIMQVGVPRLYMSNVLIIIALAFLLARRIFNERLRYISLVNDYFPLWLILGLVSSGIWLRYFNKTDIAAVKVFIMGLVHFSPQINASLNATFVIHLTFLSVLLIYFPFSKLMHFPGIFFSPTRNLANNSRMVRYVNPWNPPKKYTTYAEYEDNFRVPMAEAGLPLDKPLDDVNTKKPAE